MQSQDGNWVTTSTILARLHESDPAAWDRFVERFRDPVVRYARGGGLTPAEAEDAAQETLLAFAQSLRDERYDPAAGRLSRWLFGIAHRQIARGLARRAGRREQAPPDSRFLDEVPGRDATRTWDAEWERAMLAQCMERARREFTADTFRAFELALLPGRSAADAARELGMETKAVYNAKHRVLKRIRALRAELEDAAPPAAG